jgi:hypothetical protein
MVTHDSFAFLPGRVCTIDKSTSKIRKYQWAFSSIEVLGLTVLWDSCSKVRFLAMLTDVGIRQMKLRSAPPGPHTPMSDLNSFPLNWLQSSLENWLSKWGRKFWSWNICHVEANYQRLLTLYENDPAGSWCEGCRYASGGVTWSSVEVTCQACEDLSPWNTIFKNLLVFREF